MNKIEIIKTDDGSDSIFVPSLNEHFHSTHGAMQESLHVYIQAGLNAVIQQGHTNLNILEIGFGTGLNALLSCMHQQNSEINYHTIEKYPLPFEIFSKLNYEPAALLASIHQCQWGQEVQLLPYFSMLKEKIDLANLVLKKKYHLIYFDAFAPEKQPKMWSLEIFIKLFDSLLPGGMLVTYCAKGEVKRALKAAGFQVESLPGPPGKREITRATKV